MAMHHEIWAAWRRWIATYREPILWAALATVVVVGHWAGEAVFDTAEHVWRDGDWHGATWALVMFAALCAALWAILWLRLGAMNRVTHKHLKAFGLGSLATVAGVGAAAASWQTFDAWGHGWAVAPRDYVGGAIYWGAFLFLLVLLFRRRRTLGAVVEFPKQKTSPRRRELILFLSNLTVEKNGKPFTDRHGRPSYARGVPSWFQDDQDSRRAAKEPVDIDAALASLLRLKNADRDQKWSWEMPLRAIHHHRRALDRVTIVCSPESLAQVDWFLDIAEGYFPGKTFVVWARQGAELPFEQIDSHLARSEKTTLVTPDFEELNHLSDSIQQLLDHMTIEDRIADEDIVIDFTGGQKTTSVVAASITFDRPINAQYVRTDGKFEAPGDDIISFDLSVEPVAAGPG